MRTRSWRRAQRQRVIRKRLHIVKNKWYLSKDWLEWNWLKEGSRLAKYNLVCSCFMCSDEKYRDTPRIKNASVAQLVSSTRLLSDWSPVRIWPGAPYDDK